MEQFRNPRNHDLHAHAKSEKCDHLIDDDRPAAAQLLHDPVALRKKKIEYEAHQDDDDGDHEVVDGAPKVVKEGVSKAEAEEMKTKLEAEGAKVTLK